jgi:hypothetical protein
MSLIKISANRTVVVVQRGVLGNIGNLSRYTIGQLAPYRIGDLVSV